MKEQDDITLVRGVMQCYNNVEDAALFKGNSYAMIGQYTSFTNENYKNVNNSTDS